MERKKLVIKKPKKEKNSNFYFKDQADIIFIPSGCTVLDLTLGGGWAVGEIINLVGDRSSGKTLLAIEASANLRRVYPTAEIHYDVCGGETFDLAYAHYLGLPKDHLTMYESSTVEQWYDNMLSGALSDSNKGKVPSIYVLDSLDALSDDAEVKRKITEGTFGTKAKKVGELLRRIDKKARKKNVCLMVVSQVRDNIGVTFGKKHKRSGGKALDFWAAQCLWLAEMKKLTKTKSKITRPIGVQVKAKCEKNKVGLPFRECQFPLVFNYGMDDESACIEFLETINEKIPDTLEDMRELVSRRWLEIEASFLPTTRKY